MAKVLLLEHLEVVRRCIDDCIDEIMDEIEGKVSYFDVSVQEQLDKIESRIKQADEGAKALAKNHEKAAREVSHVIRTYISDDISLLREKIANLEARLLAVEGGGRGVRTP